MSPLQNRYKETNNFLSCESNVLLCLYISSQPHSKSTFMKHLISLLAIIAFSIGLSAQNQLTVELNDGEKISFILSDEPVVTLQESQICIITQKIKVELERCSVNCFLLTDEINSGIDNNQAVSDNLIMDYSSNGQITISGLKNISDIRMCDMSGRQIPVSISNSDNYFTLDISPISSGIFVLLIPNHDAVKITIP